jgi:hypothetical protein
MVDSTPPTLITTDPSAGPVILNTADVPEHIGVAAAAIVASSNGDIVIFSVLKAPSHDAFVSNTCST